MRARYLTITFAALTMLIGAGCPKSVQPPPGKVLLRYQFPGGRVLHYENKSETRTAFTIPFITERQQTKTETFINMTEEVIQESIGGYALVEQRVEGFRFVLYQGNKVVFDSSRPQSFPPLPQFDSIMEIKEIRVRYQISPTGAVRNTEGLEEFGQFMGPTGLSQVFQNTAPTLPSDLVAPGQSWNFNQQIPLKPAKGFEGNLTLNDNTRLVEVRTVGSSQRAVLEQTRGVTLNMDRITDEKKHKTKQVSSAKGESVTTIIFDIQRGIIIQANGRMRLSSSGDLSEQPTMDQVSIDIESTMSNKLVEQ